ncbi:hypothetical protein LCGC14_1530430 [marine sediment metagenome]|uniref:RNA polymerase sigma-70 domain-containing protein n=1 Tax=marine sediment metagenome TaxID=412755 RepID=A0A0F9IVZ0_9ZZZZ
MSGGTGFFDKADILERLTRKDDPKVRDQLILDLQPLVKALYRKHFWFIRSHELREDLLSVGLIGLIVGIDKFDISRSKGFLLYLSFSILRPMRRFVESDNQISFSVGVYEKIKKVKVLIQANKDITPREIAKHVGIHERTAHLYASWVRGEGFAFSRDAESFSHKIGKAMTSNPTQRSELERLEIEEIIQHYADNSIKDSRAKEIFLDSFGMLSGDKPETLQHWASIFNLSKQRIEQIRNRVIREFQSYTTAKGMN